MLRPPCPAERANDREVGIAAAVLAAGSETRGRLSRGVG